MQTEFSGRFFNGRSSKPHAVAVQLAARTPPMLQVRGESFVRDFPIEGAILHTPLGAEPIRIDFPDGAGLEIPDQTTYDSLAPFFRTNRLEEAAHFFEGRGMAILGALAFLVILVAGTFIYGIPLAARLAAHALPVEAIDLISKESTALLESQVLKPSELSPERQSALSAQFHALLDASELAHDTFDLRFRSAPSIGPNAFALPSGVIILLDELVELAEDDAQVIAVLAHEAAHVVERHGIQSILRSAGVYALISIVVGDASSVSSLATALPAILVDSKYSRQFETEADLFGARLLLLANRNPEDLCAILLSLEAEQPVNRTPEVLASHPDAAHRIEAIEEWVEAQVQPE